MVVVDALNLLVTSPFKDPTQTPLPNNLPIWALTKEQFAEGREEEGEDSPSMRELAEQIDSHMEVIDLNNPSSLVVLEGSSNLEISLAPTLPAFGGASPIPPTIAQDPTL